MRTEAQKRVCEAFERLALAMTTRDMVRARTPLHIADGRMDAINNLIVVEQANFVSALDAVIDERIQAATGTRP